ncbi:MAG: thioesterase family protein, partial [Bacteroidia bacterium]|nr:thioesterase family protein [Bacteroidia bacterium]
QLGPVVLYEHIHYFKEVLLGKPISVSLEITGMSEDRRFVRFEHNFYDENKKNLAFSEMLFTWIDLKTRKLAKPDKEISDRILAFPRASSFKTLLKSDLRKYNRRPIDLE